MAIKPSPWYRPERNCWCVRINGKRHNLGPHPEVAPKPTRSKKTGLWNSPPEIDEAFRKLQVQRTAPTTATVQDVFREFIAFTRENRAPITAKRYQDFLEEFINATDGANRPQIGLLSVGQVNAGHVTRWLKERTTWGPTTKRNAITAVQAAFNWGVSNCGLPYNPIRGMKKPVAQTRTTVIAPERFDELLAMVAPQFRDLLVVSFDSGARPFEIKDLEARHLQLDRERAVLPPKESKGRKQPREFYFPTARSMEVIKRLAELRSEGPLFLNEKGRKWTGDAVKNAFIRLEKKSGTRLFQYALRHSRITDWLISGVDSHVVAKLSGHSNTAMLDAVYSHVADDHEFMQRQAQTTRPEE